MRYDREWIYGEQVFKQDVDSGQGIHEVKPQSLKPPNRCEASVTETG